MKVNQIAKAVAAVTTLGVFLAGCSGGDPTPTRATSTPTTNNTTTTLPTASGAPVVGGGGTVSVGGNAVIDDVAAKQMAQDAKLDQILAAANSANSNSKKAKDKANWAMWIGVGVAGAIAAGAVANGIRESRSEEEGAGFFGGLFGSHYGQTSDIAKAKAKEATDNVSKRLDSTDGKVAETKSAVESARASSDKQFGQVGSEVGQLKTAAGVNILTSAANLKATAAVGGKTEQILKGQDSQVAQMRTIKSGVDSINKTASAIQTSQEESAKTLAQMTKQLSDVEEVRQAMVKQMDTIVKQTSDEASKARLTMVFDEYKKQMDSTINAARDNVKQAYADAMKSNTPEMLAKAIVGEMSKNPQEAKLSVDGLNSAVSMLSNNVQFQDAVKKATREAMEDLQHDQSTGKRAAAN